MIIHAAFMIENIAQECKDMIYGVGLLLLMMETEGGLWRMNHNDYYAKESINTNKQFVTALYIWRKILSEYI